MHKCGRLGKPVLVEGFTHYAHLFGLGRSCKVGGHIRN